MAQDNFAISVDAKRDEILFSEKRRLEQVFISIRWLWVGAAFVLVLMRRPDPPTTMLSAALALALINIIAFIANKQIKTSQRQLLLGVVMLSVDALMASVAIMQFVSDFYTAAYAVFGYVIIEAAVRFGLIGSFSALAYFVLGLFGAYLYRKAAFDVRFSYTGFAYWTALMTIISVTTGTIVRSQRIQRQRSDQRLAEISRLLEQERITSELSAKNIADLESIEPLTAREKEVIGLIMRGKGNKEIAVTLGIKQKTVKNYINNIYSKLQVKTRYEAISYIFKKPK